MPDKINPFDKDTADLKQAKKEKLYQKTSGKDPNPDGNVYADKGNVPGAAGNAVEAIRQYKYNQKHSEDDTRQYSSDTGSP